MTRPLLAPSILQAATAAAAQGRQVVPVARLRRAVQLLDADAHRIQCTGDDNAHGRPA